MENCLVVIDRVYKEKYTKGSFKLWIGAQLLFECFTLELPWKYNKRNISCISEGVFDCVEDNTGKHRFYKVHGVKGRSGIEFHVINSIENTEGCIGIGLGCLFDKNRCIYTILNSSNALAYLQFLGVNKFTLIIKSDSGPICY